MAKTRSNILKSSDVKFEGCFRLELGPRGAAPTGGSTGGAPLQVRITENNPEFAVIQIVCSCGKTASVKCQYTNAQSKSEQVNETQ